jgi:hypothetical protein
MIISQKGMKPSHDDESVSDTMARMKFAFESAFR